MIRDPFEAPDLEERSDKEPPEFACVRLRGDEVTIRFSDDSGVVGQSLAVNYPDLRAVWLGRSQPNEVECEFTIDRAQYDEFERALGHAIHGELAGAVRRSNQSMADRRWADVYRRGLTSSPGGYRRQRRRSGYRFFPSRRKVRERWTFTGGRIIIPPRCDECGAPFGVCGHPPF